MSLGVVVKGASGVVLSADTRVTLTVREKAAASIPFSVPFDNATKLLALSSPHDWFASVTYGDALIGTRTVHSYMPEFELTLGTTRLSTLEYSNALSKFFLARWNDEDMSQRTPGSAGVSFITAGYDDGQPYGTVFLFNVPHHPTPDPRNEGGFGMTWGGQIEVVDRVIQGYDSDVLPLLVHELSLSKSQVERFRNAAAQRFAYRIPYDVLPLQDCIDLAVFLIRTTMTAQNLAVTNRGVGGAIDVVAITPTEGLQWIQRNQLRGETS